MPSIGELFIQLGVVGDVKPLEKAIGTMKEAVKQIDNQINANQRLLKYLQDIKTTRTAGEKAIIKENFANETKKQKLLDEIDANQKAVDEKKEFAAKIAGVVKGVGLFVGAMTGAAVALNKFTNDLVQSNQAMLDLTRTTDIAQGTFQKWNNIGKMLGVENAAQQLEGLNQRMFELMLTGEGARGFQLAGINPVGQDAEGVLEQLRDRVSGMDDTTATYLLQQMGLDPKMLHLLRLSRQEFEELGATVQKYQLTPEQTKQIQAMNVQLQIAAIKLQYLKDRAILAIMPAWVKLVESFARVTEGIQKAVNWLNEFKSKSPDVQNAIKGIAIAVGILLAALFPVQALLIGLYLLIDDIMAYFNGGRSGIGYLIGWIDEYKKELQEKFGDLSLNKVIPQVTLDVGEVLIKAAKLSLENWGENAIKDTFSGHADDVTKNNPFNSLKLLYALGYATKKAIEERHSEALKEKYGEATGGAAPLIGYNGELPDISSMFITPAMQQNVRNNNSNTVTNNDNKVSMTNYIQTSQPAFDIQNQLNYARFAMGNAIV